MPVTATPKVVSTGSLERDAAAVAAWEARRRDVLDDLGNATAEYRAALDRAHERYAAAVAAALRARGVTGPAAERVLRAEGRAFANASSTATGAVGRALDAELRGAGSAARLAASVVAIQRAWRWHRWRVMCRDGTRRLALREKAAREIASSEASYVQSLELLVREYLVPLRQQAQGIRGGGGSAGEKGSSLPPPPVLSAAQLQDLFLNVEEVLAFSRDLRAKVDARMAAFDNRTTCVGDVFEAAAPAMAPVYERFVSGFDRSTAVQGALAESAAYGRWEDAVAARPALRHLRLNALLIMPVQRVPRYMLLLRELLALTDAAHPDRAALERALAAVQRVAARANEAKRAAEARQRVAALARQLRGAVPLVRPFRVFLREGPAAQHGCPGPRPCHLVLLTDQLLVAKKPTASRLIARIGLLGASVTDVDEGGSEGGDVGADIFGGGGTSSDTAASLGPALRLRNSGGACTLAFATEPERREWADALRDAIAALPGILEKYPRDREQALILAAAGTNTGTGSGSGYGFGSSSISHSRIGSGSGALTSVVRAAGALDSNAGLLTILTQDSGSGSAGGSGSGGAESARPQFEGKIRDIVLAYDEVARLQGEIMRAPVDLRTLFPAYMAQLHPDHIQRLRARIDLLGQKLRAIDALDQRAAALMVSEKAFHTLGATLDEGDAPLAALKGLVLAYFPAQRVAELGIPRNRDPQLLLRFVLHWYVRLCEAWQAVLQLSWM